MSFIKRTYADEQTVITAKNMNDIQDAILEHERKLPKGSCAESYLPQLTGAQVGQYLEIEEVDGKGQVMKLKPVAAPNGGSGNGGISADDLEGYATEKWVQEGYQPKGDYALRSEIPNVPVQDEIVAAVIAALPVYNGEVENV